MYAIFNNGGKQYLVKKGDVISVEKIDGKAGDKVEFDEVLVKNDGKDVIGTPFVTNAKVTAVIKDQMRERKIIIFKKRRRQNSRRKNGHRQAKTQLEIISV